MGLISYICRCPLVLLFKLILTFIPKDENLILCSAWFGQKYSDSSRYIFEYLLKQGKYNLIWNTSNKDLYKELKEKGIPVVYSNSIIGWWTQARAKMLISSVQTSDFNNFLYRKCIFFDLDHGFTLKEAGFAIPGTDRRWFNYQMLLRWGMQYWMSAPAAWSMEKVCLEYNVKPEQVVKCNKPRTDVLFDVQLQESKNQIIEEIKAGRKAIVWMPTHRSCGEKQIEISKLVDLDKLQRICEKFNFVFIIKKHFYHRNEKENLEAYSNIFDVTNDDVDAQVILAQADALVSDYSASYIEYLILDRPIILYAYDKEEFLSKERGLYIPLEKNKVGEVVTERDQFLCSIERIAGDWYDSNFAEGRNESKLLYFNKDADKGHFRQEVASIIDELMTGSYQVTWY